MLAGADRVIGTSAGALLSARLLGGGSLEGLAAPVAELAGVRLRAPVVARLLGAQVWPSRRHALIWLGRAARRPVALTEDAFVGLVGRAVGAIAWPASLVVVAVDADSGRPAYFTARSKVDLHPRGGGQLRDAGSVPPVTIEDRTFLGRRAAIPGERRPCRRLCSGARAGSERGLRASGAASGPPGRPAASRGCRRAAARRPTAGPERDGRRGPAGVPRTWRSAGQAGGRCGPQTHAGLANGSRGPSLCSVCWVSHSR